MTLVELLHTCACEWACPSKLWTMVKSWASARTHVFSSIGALEIEDAPVSGNAKEGCAIGGVPSLMLARRIRHEGAWS